MPARRLFFLKVALTPPPLSGLHSVPSSGPEARSPYIHFVYVVCFAATGVASLRTRGGFVRLLYLSAAGGHFPAEMQGFYRKLFEIGSGVFETAGVGVPGPGTAGVKLWSQKEG
ncbi:MAG: hypothetical protein AB1426_05050 [Bacillota bacterium]